MFLMRLKKGKLEMQLLWMQQLKANEFIFSSRYRLWRHILYWSFHISIWAGFWVIMEIPIPYERQLVYMALWIPAFILFGYPLAYVAIPYLLLKGKVLLFFLAILAWGVAGLYIDEAYRSYIIIPFQEAWGKDPVIPSGPLASCYLCMTTSAASPMLIRFFKLWSMKQQAWMQAQQEKVIAQLQLLRAQLHPHFLFNTLNNIYAFALKNSPKTPEMILRLSSLLSYMLYECRGEEVLLEKEVEVMKNYIELEKERYGDKIDVSVNIVGDLCDKYISPLLILPFLENAFKHGTSEQLGRPWMSLDISLKDHLLKCKVVNSKNEFVPHHQNGVGIDNVRKRLEFVYHKKYELKLADEGDFFVVSLTLELHPTSPGVIRPVSFTGQNKMPAYEDALSVNR
ncbi:MAG TPA: histidine kinase [Flavisolibacter sp.]